MNQNLDAVIDWIRFHPKLVAAEDFEIVCQQSQMRKVHYTNGERVSEENNDFVWVQLRVFLRKKVGVASTVFLDKASLIEMIERAFELSGYTEVNPWFRFPIWKQQSLSSELPWDPATVTWDTDFFESLFPQLRVQPLGLEERYEEHKDLRKIFRKTERSLLKDGSHHQRMHFSVVAQGVGEGQSQVYRVDERRGSTSPFLSKADCLDGLMRKVERLKTGKPLQAAPQGSYLLHGSVLASILRNLEPLFCGDLSKTPYGQGMELVDKMIFPDAVSLVDEGTLLRGEGYRKYDLEGVKLQKTTIVDKGIFKTFLHNTTTATRYNRASTGNYQLRADLSPRVGVNHCYLVPTERKPLELFQAMQNGIYLECLDRMDRDLTPEGKLELVGHGWRVQNGDPVEPIRYLILNWDPLEVFKQITMVGSDLDFWGRYGAPSVFLERMPLEGL